MLLCFTSLGNTKMNACIYNYIKYECIFIHIGHIQDIFFKNLDIMQPFTCSYMFHVETKNLNS